MRERYPTRHLPTAAIRAEQARRQRRWLELLAPFTPLQPVRLWALRLRYQRLRQGGRR